MFNVTTDCLLSFTGVLHLRNVPHCCNSTIKQRPGSQRIFMYVGLQQTQRIINTMCLLFIKVSTLAIGNVRGAWRSQPIQTPQKAANCAIYSAGPSCQSSFHGWADSIYKFTARSLALFPLALSLHTDWIAHIKFILDVIICDTLPVAGSACHSDTQCLHKVFSTWHARTQPKVAKVLTLYVWVEV